MRSITISYEYEGSEETWRAAIDGFIDALNDDPVASSRFSYQVGIADDLKTRVHWGYWDNAETLAHVQAQDYFKTFAAQVKGFSGGGPTATVTNVVTRTRNW